MGGLCSRQNAMNCSLRYSVPLSKSSPARSKGIEASTSRVCATRAEGLRRQIARFSVQPEQGQVKVTDQTKPPDISPPQWATVSVSSQPGRSGGRGESTDSGISRAQKKRTRFRCLRLGGLGQTRRGQQPVDLRRTYP